MSIPPTLEKASSSATNGSVHSEAFNHTATAPDELLDHTIFDQLLEMDDDDEREFSKSIVWNFFEQAEVTFGQMEQAIVERDFNKASSLGHFLKGSSAALGMTKVKTSCERIQHFGALKAADGVAPIGEEEALERLTGQVQQVKVEYTEAEEYLKKFYGEA
ncbi:signal transduction histidine kinase [Protomyces lactucae-debilis]|uniref:Signal transduction histidine kinase n=1 Tax=Protomyces lactucae-debilis TaxID=2754530 RepID=A0A1Y2FKH1_PROLT|nr:signal transduction histidine kinase [Protomyces lactucae-debilis]ORY84460.1 signal transduction histidine kinase [Protomyces lactucae-debilis]